MKNIINKLTILLFIVLALPYLGNSQDNLTFDLEYGVHRVYPYISITKEKLNKAQTIADLNKHYKPSWVREYITVELVTSYKGKVKKAVSINDLLTQEQKDIMDKADVDTDISVYVKYIPENTLKQNDSKEINFSFKVDPESEAKFPGGEKQLNKYLKENAVDKIPGGIFRQHHLTAVKFTINEEGQISDAHVFESSRDEEADKILLETICNMPNWKPAEYANGVKVKQDFAFAVGDMNSCVINLINIHQD